ncbi:MAG: glycosyltransferase family 39 protein [Elusimicrobiota bacterium]
MTGRSSFSKIIPGFLLLFSLLMLIPLTNRETSYTLPAEYRWTLPTVVETVSDGALFIPRLWGKPRFRKPPLVYWLMAGSAKLFSFNLFWIRLPVVLFSALSLLLVYFFMKTLNADEKECISASLILLGFFGYYTYSRIAALEVPMLFFTLASFYGLAVFFLKDRPFGIFIASFFSGLTMMTKSHATVFSIVIFILLWVLFNRDWHILKKNRAPILMGIVIFLLVVLPWYIYLLSAYGNAFISDITGELVGERYKAGHYDLIGMLVGILALVFPFTLLFLNSLHTAFIKKTRENRFLLIYIISVILPYVFITSQKMRYMVPLLPAAACMISLNIKDFGRSFPVIMRLTGLLLAVPALIILWLGIKLGIIPLPTLFPAIGAAAATFYFFYRKKPVVSFAMTAVFEFIFIGLIYSGIGLWQIPDGIADKVKTGKTATFRRRPFFLAVKTKQKPFIDVTDTESFKKAAGNNALLYIAQHDFPKFEALMKESGFTRYRKAITWVRFNEFPKDRDVKEAFYSGDVEKLKEKTYFINNIE